MVVSGKKLIFENKYAKHRNNSKKIVKSYSDDRCEYQYSVKILIIKLFFGLYFLVF